MADLYCRGCGDELRFDEYGNDECDVCAANQAPGEYEVFSCEEEEDE